MLCRTISADFGVLYSCHVLLSVALVVCFYVQKKMNFLSEVADCSYEQLVVIVIWFFLASSAFYFVFIENFIEV